MIVASRQASRAGAPVARPVTGLGLALEDEVAFVAGSDAPSIQSAQVEPAVNVETAKSPGATVLARSG
jgi:hypothetical protein